MTDPTAQPRTRLALGVLRRSRIYHRRGDEVAGVRMGRQQRFDLVLQRPISVGGSLDECRAPF